MVQPSLLFTALAAVCVASACSDLPPRTQFPDLGELSDEALLELLEARAQSVRSLYAELTMIYAGPDFDGSFDAVVHYRAPGSMRITAFKNLIFSIENIFDLVLTPDGWTLSMVEEEGAASTVTRGSAGFVEAHPEFAEFFWAREAFCAPGLTTDGRARLTREGDSIRISGRLSSGATVTWRAGSRTLEIHDAVVEIPGGGETLLEYSDYRLLDGVFVPGRVFFRNPTGQVTIDSRLEYLELNTTIDPAVFAHAIM